MCVSKFLNLLLVSFSTFTILQLSFFDLKINFIILNLSNAHVLNLSVFKYVFSLSES